VSKLCFNCHEANRLRRLAEERAELWREMADWLAAALADNQRGPKGERMTKAEWLEWARANAEATPRPEPADAAMPSCHWWDDALHSWCAGEGGPEAYTLETIHEVPEGAPCPCCGATLPTEPPDAGEANVAPG
jgi:hypothetical protein